MFESFLLFLVWVEGSLSCVSSGSDGFSLLTETFIFPTIFLMVDCSFKTKNGGEMTAKVSSTVREKICLTVVGVTVAGDYLLDR